MALNHATIINAIEAILVANASPVFTVIMGEPMAVPLGDRYACCWYTGRQAIYGNVRGQMEVTETYHIACFWLRRPEPTTLETFENEIADADQALCTAFRAQSTLTNPHTEPFNSSPCLNITPSQVSWGTLGRQGSAGVRDLYRALEFDLEILDREGEPTVL